MAFGCFTELVEKITETDRVAVLAQSLLDDSGSLGFQGDLTEAKHRRTTANAMTKSALVLLSGYFEGFLKKIIEEFIETINDLQLPLQKTSDDLLLSIFQHSINENRPKSMPRALKIKTSIIDETHFPLFQDVIGGTKGNPTVDTVENIFQRLGIPAIIDQLSIKDYSLESTYTTVRQSQQLHQKIELAVEGDVAKIQKVIEMIDEKWAPKKQRREVGYVSRIQELLKRRNRIAHGENWGEQVTPTELLEFNRDILKLCKGIDDCLSKELQSYQNK